MQGASCRCPSTSPSSKSKLHAFPFPILPTSQPLQEHKSEPLHASAWNALNKLFIWKMQLSKPSGHCHSLSEYTLVYPGVSVSAPGPPVLWLYLARGACVICSGWSLTVSY